LKVECLAALEQLSRRSLIDLYYGDESRVCLQGCVPYGWQFADEEVFVPSSQGAGLNCFALLTRGNACHFATTPHTIDSAFVVEQLEQLSFSVQFSLQRMTVVVLDNARVHKSKAVQERRAVWEERGLFLFYLPPYSPHLNIVEVLWRKLKYEWLQPSDYASAQMLFYQTRQALAAVGTLLRINFSEFALGLK
jgi:transposase